MPAGVCRANGEVGSAQAGWDQYEVIDPKQLERGDRQTGQIRSHGITTLVLLLLLSPSSRVMWHKMPLLLPGSESLTASLEAGPLGYAVFLGTEKHWGHPDVTVCPSCTSSMRAGPFSETSDSAGSREQPPLVWVQRGTGLPCAQCHPKEVAQFPAFIGSRVGCL